MDKYQLQDWIDQLESEQVILKEQLKKARKRLKKLRSSTSGA